MPLKKKIIFLIYVLHSLESVIVPVELHSLNAEDQHFFQQLCDIRVMKLFWYTIYTLYCDLQQEKLHFFPFYYQETR